jgi:internalin A
MTRPADDGLHSVEPLGALTQLSRLTLRHNLVTDPEPLQALPALTMLNVSDNRIADAASVAGCDAVDELWIGGNLCTDVRPPATMTDLKGVDLEGTDPVRLTGVEALRRGGIYVGGLA